MAISIKSASVQKNTDGSYQVNVLHTDGKTSVVSFTHVPFAAEMAAAYADFVNGAVKVGTVLTGDATVVEADAKKLLADAQVEAGKVKAEAETLLAAAKVEASKLKADAEAAVVKIEAEASKLLAEARTEAAKLLADAKAEVAKLTA